MKISDIIREDVDMSFWSEYDDEYNPEAQDYADKQDRRQKMLTKGQKGTPVIRNPVRKSQARFSNKPKKDAPMSPGYVGNVDVRVKAGHISRKKGRDLTS